MNNNDVLRRLRYTFNFNDKKMAAIFSSAGLEVSREQISQWLKKETDDDCIMLADHLLATFLNGFINEKRGKKPGSQAVAEKRLTNNIILTKLKIALNLQAEQIIELLATVDFRISKPELSAFTRKKDHKHYRECKDQVLRNLLQAIDKAFHVERTKKFQPSDKKENVHNNQAAKSGKAKTASKTQKSLPPVDGARPNASSVYYNPNVSDKPKRNKLKLSK